MGLKLPFYPFKLYLVLIKDIFDVYFHPLNLSFNDVLVFGRCFMEIFGKLSIVVHDGLFYLINFSRSFL